MLEKKLGIKNNDKKKKKINTLIDKEGFGDGFMNFIDGIEEKVKVDKSYYKPQEYVFSDGEGPVEEDFFNAGDVSDSDQEGFDDNDSDGDVKTTKKFKK